MYLSELKLWSFRKFGSNSNFDRNKPDFIISFQKGLNLLVGENDSGKTAIVDAIKYVLLTNSREYIRLEIDDFYNYHQISKDKKQTLRIECHFKFNAEDNDSKAKNFLDWGHFNDKGEFELRIFFEAEQKNGKIEPYDIRGGMDNEGVVLDARARELLRITYLKPLRDAKEELKPKKGSRLSQVLDSHSTFAEKDNHFLTKTVKIANKEITNFFEGNKSHHHTLLDEIKQILGSENTLMPEIEEKFNPYLHDSDKKGDELANRINAYLSNFFGIDTSSQFKISETNLRGILERLSLHLDRTNAGLGSHNLLFIAVELLLLEKEDDFTGLRLALIEEIEAHLHPQAQMRLVEYLQKECSNKGVQMLLTTHSPNLASKVKLENLIICRDNYAYPMGSEYTMLEKGDYAFLERFLDVTKANLFFAKGVILVEGDAENLLLPTIAKIIDCDLTQNGVSIINLGGLTFKYYERIFIQKDKPQAEQMNTPVAVVTDVDTKVWEFYDDTDNEKHIEDCYELSQSVIDDVIAQYSDDFENLIFDTTKSVFEKFEEGVLVYFRSYLKDGKKRLPNGFKNFVKSKIIRREITEAELSNNQKQVKTLKEQQHSPAENDKVKGFVNTYWTLEYELALSSLKEQFFTATLMAKDYDYFVLVELETYEQRAKTQIAQWVTESKTPQQIAYQIYWVEMMGKGTNKTSKATVAHFFAEILEIEMKEATQKAALKQEIETDEYLKYLVDAIKHATSKS
ncbi:MAG: AAA family ATPase [Chitinophagales bacterium]|nr:AAA family ATPase [Chitinophagales bacterium]